MIANKHTELRLVSNLNDLLEDSKEKQEINKKIHKHTFEYMMSYVSENDLEGANFYDKLEELSSSYQKHCYNIAKEIKEEILKENGEEIEIIKSGFEGYDPNAFRCQKVEKEIFLDPKKFSQEFKDNLEEDLTSLIIDSYFKELDNIIKIIEYQKKIDNLREKQVKTTVKENKKDIQDTIRERIEIAYRVCFNNNKGNARKVLDNFEIVKEIREELFDSIYKYIFYGLDIEVNKDSIESMFNKELNSFIKEKRAILGISKTNKQPIKKVNKNVGIAKLVVITKLWKDITK